MKKAAEVVGLAVIADYLIFSFARWDLNPAQWSIDVRVGSIMLLAALTIIVTIWKIGEKNL